MPNAGQISSPRGRPYSGKVEIAPIPVPPSRFLLTKKFIGTVCKETCTKRNRQSSPQDRNESNTRSTAVNTEENFPYAKHWENVRLIKPIPCTEDLTRTLSDQSVTASLMDKDNLDWMSRYVNLGTKEKPNFYVPCLLPANLIQGPNEERTERKIIKDVSMQTDAENLKRTTSLEDLLNKHSKEVTKDVPTILDFLQEYKSKKERQKESGTFDKISKLSLPKLEINSFSKCSDSKKNTYAKSLDKELRPTNTNAKEKDKYSNYSKSPKQLDGNIPNELEQFLKHFQTKELQKTTLLLDDLSAAGDTSDAFSSAKDNSDQEFKESQTYNIVSYSRKSYEENMHSMSDVEEFHYADDEEDIDDEDVTDVESIAPKKDASKLASIFSKHRTPPLASQMSSRIPCSKSPLRSQSSYYTTKYGSSNDKYEKPEKDTVQNDNYVFNHIPRLRKKKNLVLKL